LPGGTGEGAALTDLIDTVRASINYALTNLVENLELTASGLTATGNDMANRITGSAGSDTLDGGIGVDTLIGGGGNDTLIWHPGDSPVGIYNGGAGTDTLGVRTDSDGDSIDLRQAGRTALLSIEKVDMREGSDNDLTVSARDILDMSSTDKLTVQGDEGDQVFAAGFRKLANSGGMKQYSATVSGKTAILLVETDVQVIL
jgi:Ca2+-binding RTX toxin-like protein